MDKLLQINLNILTYKLWRQSLKLNKHGFKHKSRKYLNNLYK